jgi:hypothetical protein
MLIQCCVLTLRAPDPPVSHVAGSVKPVAAKPLTCEGHCGQLRQETTEPSLELKRVSLELKRVSLELKRVSLELKRVSLELKRVSLKLKRVSLELKRVSLELKRVSLELKRVPSPLRGGLAGWRACLRVYAQSGAPAGGWHQLSYETAPLTYKRVSWQSLTWERGERAEAQRPPREQRSHVRVEQRGEAAAGSTHLRHRAQGSSMVCES